MRALVVALHQSSRLRAFAWYRIAFGVTVIVTWQLGWWIGAVRDSLSARLSRRPESHKARQLKARMREKGWETLLFVRNSGLTPGSDCLCESIILARDRSVTLVGSSLGGYYATYLASGTSCGGAGESAVVAHLSLLEYVGPQTIYLMVSNSNSRISTSTNCECWKYRRYPLLSGSGCWSKPADELPGLPPGSDEICRRAANHCGRGRP